MMLGTNDLNYRLIEMDIDLDYMFDLYERISKDSIIQAQGYWCEEERYDSFLRGVSFDETYILEQDGRAFGCFCLTKLEESLSLQRMYIEPDMQGKGIGSKIIDYAITQAALLNKICI